MKPHFAVVVLVCQSVIFSAHGFLFFDWKFFQKAFSPPVSVFARAMNRNNQDGLLDSSSNDTLSTSASSSSFFGFRDFGVPRNSRQVPNTNGNFLKLISWFQYLIVELYFILQQQLLQFIHSRVFDIPYF